MRGYRDDDVTRTPERRSGTAREHGSAPSRLRTYGLVVGFVLAVAATAVVFLTDNPQYLRLAVIGAAWAFVLAAFLAGRRRADAQAAADREAEIRRSYEYELDREAAAHREQELELRREVEESMATELTSLRAEVAELSLLRHEVARVARLGTDLPALSGLRAEIESLSGLREDVAQLTSLRGDLASLAALREDLAPIAELRTEMGRLRAELTEQLSGEMLIERIMLRTQSIRTSGEPDAPRTVETPPTWEGERPPRELTGGWPAVRLDELTETRQTERTWVEQPATPPGRPFSAAPRPAWEPPPPPTSSFPLASPSAASTPAPAAPSYSPAPPTPLEWLADRALVGPADLATGRSRHAAAEADDVPPPHERSGAMPADLLPPVPPRRRRTDEPFDDRTTEHPATPATGYEPVVRPSPTPRPSPRPTPPPVQPAPAVGDETQTAGHQRLAEILADNGAEPPSGGRRRRRYREEDEPDDVLARVLGRQ